MTKEDLGPHKKFDFKSSYKTYFQICFKGGKEEKKNI